MSLTTQTQYQPDVTDLSKRSLPAIEGESFALLSLLHFQHFLETSNMPDLRGGLKRIYIGSKRSFVTTLTPTLSQGILVKICRSGVRIPSLSGKHDLTPTLSLMLTLTLTPRRSLQWCRATISKRAMRSELRLRGCRPISPSPVALALALALALTLSLALALALALASALASAFA